MGDFENFYSRQGNVESIRTTNLFKKVDLLLHDYTGTAENLTKPKEESGPRYYNHGYESHYNAVCADEVAQWKNKFSYLRVEGTTIAAPKCENLAYEGAVEFHPRYTKEHSDICMESEIFDLSIVGRNIQLKLPIDENNLSMLEDSESDIDISDGFLESFEKIDNRSNIFVTEEEDLITIPIDTNDKNDICITWSPELVHRNELVDNQLDKVWPYLAPHLVPLIVKIKELRAQTQAMADTEEAGSTKMAPLVDIGNRQGIQSDDYEW